MTVYELIQELAYYKPDTEVLFHVHAEFEADAEVEVDRSSEYDFQDVSVPVEFDGNAYYSDIKDNERTMLRPSIVIELEN